MEQELDINEAEVESSWQELQQTLQVVAVVVERELEAFDRSAATPWGAGSGCIETSDLLLVPAGSSAGKWNRGLW